MTSVAYGIAFPASRGVLTPAPPPPPLDQVSGVTITGAWGIDRLLLSSFNGQNRGRVRDTTGAGTSYTDFVTPADASAFLGADAGAIVSLYDQSGHARTLTNATAGQQPAFATGIGPNARAGALFDATDDKLVGAALSNFISATAGYFVAAVRFTAITLNNAAPTQQYLNQTILGDSAQWTYMTGRVGFLDGGSFDTTFRNCECALPGTDTAVMVFEMWKDATTTYSRINGGTTVSTASGNIGALTGLLSLGKAAATAGALNAAILEAAAMSAVPAQANALVANMMSYYGA